MTTVEVLVPHDLVFEIIRRLPVVTLVRFKAVCKDWSDLISQPRFQSIQRGRCKMAAASSTIINDSFSITTFENYSRCASFLLYAYAKRRPEWLPDGLMEIFKRDVLAKEIWSVGYSHGVFLVHNFYGSAALYNHATRESSIIALADYTSDIYKSVTYGFGSEELEDGRIDFLVMSLYAYGSDTIEKAPKLYRSSTGSWKDLNPFPKEYNTHHVVCVASAYVNGIFYWSAREKHNNYKPFLISFDYRNQIYGKIYIPTFVMDGYRPDVKMGVGCYTSHDSKWLSLLYSTKGDTNLHICIRDGSSWLENVSQMDKCDIHYKESQAKSNPNSDIWFIHLQREESLFSVSSSDWEPCLLSV